MLMGIVKKEKTEIENFNDDKYNVNNANEDDATVNKLMIYNEMEKILQEKKNKLQ
jgi:hypothetical protein